MEETNIKQNENQKSNVVSAEDGEPVVTIIDTDNSGKGRYDLLKRGDVYEFTIVDEGLDIGISVPMVSMIIGEVDSVKNNVVKLAAWAYPKEPTTVGSATEITVLSCSDLSLDDWYKFMQARLAQMTICSSEDEEMNDECAMLKHNFAKHLVEDVTSNRISLVLKPNEPGGANEYYLYATPAKIFMLGEEPICKITEELKMVVKDYDDIPVVFGCDAVIRYSDYCRQVEAVKAATDKYVEEQLNKDNVITETIDGVDTKVNEPVNKQQKCNDLKPNLFGNAIDAADTIDPEDDSQYIIVVPMSADKAEVTLTDDPHSILHSRHLIGKEVIVYGPVKNNYFANISDVFRVSTLI